MCPHSRQALGARPRQHGRQSGGERRDAPMSEDLAAVETPVEIEQRTIAQVPDAERKGKVRNLFTIWFASNVMLLTVVTGALATTVYGLSIWWAIVGLVIGNLFGGVFMALHSAQGPRLGVPQMIQSRGQFGSYGALVVVAVVIIMYLGFIASNTVLGGQAINNLVH